MAITRTQKEAQVENLKKELEQSSIMVMTAYSGLSVTDAQELRKKIKSEGGNFRIVKNAMLKLAVEQSFSGIDLSDLEGPVAVAFGYEDPVMPAKALDEFAKQYGALQPIGAINARGDHLNAEQVKQLANLPSREVLTGQLVGTIAAPISGFVNVLNGNLRGLVTALDGIAQSREA